MRRYFVVLCCGVVVATKQHHLGGLREHAREASRMSQKDLPMESVLGNDYKIRYSRKSNELVLLAGAGTAGTDRVKAEHLKRAEDFQKRRQEEQAKIRPIIPATTEKATTATTSTTAEITPTITATTGTQQTPDVEITPTITATKGTQQNPDVTDRSEDHTTLDTTTTTTTPNLIQQTLDRAIDGLDSVEDRVGALERLRLRRRAPAPPPSPTNLVLRPVETTTPTPTFAMPDTGTPTVDDVVGESQQIESAANRVLSTINSQERDELRRHYAEALHDAQAKAQAKDVREKAEEAAVRQRVVVQQLHQQVAKFEVDRRKKRLDISVHHDTNIPGVTSILRQCGSSAHVDIRGLAGPRNACLDECKADDACVAVVFEAAGTTLKNTIGGMAHEKGCEAYVVERNNVAETASALALVEE